jgi:photosystem II stability/assembly factor-like uncharacterized protein
MSVSKTTDNGSSWNRYQLTVTDGFTYCLAVDPTNSDIVYAGGVPGLYKTTNGGADWADISSGLSGYIYAIAIDQESPATVFAGTPHGVFKSIDSGKTWINTECRDVNAILVHKEDPDTVYAGTSQGVFVSTTGGGDWTEMNEGLDMLEITSLGMNNTYLFAGTDGRGIYRWGFEIGKEEDKSKPPRNQILCAQPNPMRRKTAIRYVLSQQSYIELTVYGIQGRVVRTLASQMQEPGTYTMVWDGLDEEGEAVSSGVYFCHLFSQSRTDITKLVLLR